MTKCENCYHKKVCIDSANYRNAENCRQYKDKSLIVELPCRFGDAVYEIISSKEGDTHIISAVVCAIHIANGSRNSCNHKRESYILAECPNTKYCKKYVLSKIGKTVFLSREDAERALKEREINA